MMKHFGFFSYIKERWVVLISLIAVFAGLLLLLTLFPNHDHAHRTWFGFAPVRGDY